MIEPLAAPLRRIGVDVVGVADGAAWQRVLPGCRSVVVFASGGDALWRAWLGHLAGRPAEIDLPHPLDAFVRSALPADTGEVRWLPCAADAPLQVDFRALALAAGLGWRSRLDLVLHPTHGPWLGLRAAAFTTAALRPT
ncbi:MAG TPA: hypothetical protein PKA64_06100, partial [Myxococcota bacterium]|nr:hypothetical protein [Myxococcota bacterium]